MIDTSSESLISLNDAASLLPRRRAGKKPHISCLYRWSTIGCKGIVLDTIQIGGTRCTSREAIQRFCESLSRPGGSATSTPTRTDKQRAKDIAAAENKLIAMGA